MEYSTDVNVRDLGIDTDDLIQLAEDNGDELMYREEAEELIAELQGAMSLLEDEIKALKTRAVDVEVLESFITTSLRVAVTEISRAIVDGDYYE
jgi:hypothetical protein